MIMNKIEFWLMNNPVRSFVQKYEAKRMKDMTEFSGGKVLEIGCGQGVGSLLIQKVFHPGEIVAIDLDPKMIARAKKKVRQSNITFKQASVTKLPFENSTFDAVIDFGILHHVPDWHIAIVELHRVLKPGGKVILEDLSQETFNLPLLGWVMKKVLDHPYRDMFDRKQFIQACEDQGFSVINYKENFFWFNAILEK